jgi:DNA-binding protein H-NS
MAERDKQHSFDIRELMDGRKGKGKETVAVKYRDPKNPSNTWTGRGACRGGWRWPPRATRPRRKIF